MLDFGKNYGTYDGITFFGDHENEGLVYYLPDEVTLTLGKESHYGMDLTIFHKGQIVSSEEINLDDMAGSILQMDVCCIVEESRLNKALDQLKEQVSLPSDLSVSQPTWKDGTVDLMVLNKQRSVAEKEEKDSKTGFVKTILGSRKPSFMTNDLKCAFNVELSRDGTELVLAALKGEKGALAGVMYDLQFAGLMPAADLRITANLRKCQETIEHELGVDFTYQREVDVSLAAGLHDLTEKMEENGGINVEVLSMGETAEERKRIQELVTDFKERVLEELFSPQINMQAPQIDFSVGDILNSSGIKDLVQKDKEDKKETNPKKGGKADGKGPHGEGNSNADEGAGDSTGEGKENGAGDNKDKDKDKKGKAAPPSFKVSYVFKREKIESDKVLQVDYRERSTIIKTHNPQSHLWLFGLQLGDSLDGYITEVEMGELWKDQVLETDIDPELFQPGGLSYVDVAFWKIEYGVGEGDNGSPFDAPATTSPLVVTLRKETPKGFVKWTRDHVDDVGYYYQACFNYGDLRILSEPQVSFSKNLVIVPELCIFSKVLHVQSYGIDYDIIRNVDVRFDISDPEGERMPEFVSLSEQHNEDSLTVRGRYRNNTSIQMTRLFSFMDGTKLQSTTSVFGTEVPIYTPLLNKNLTLVFSDVSNNIYCVLMDVTVSSNVYEGHLRKHFEFKDFSSLVVQAPVNVLDENDMVSYEISAVRTSDGALFPVMEGIAEGKPISIKLGDAGRKNLFLEWEGCSPESAGYKKIEVRVQEEGKEETIYKFSGFDVPGPIDLNILADAKVSVKIIRQWPDNEKEPTEKPSVKDGKIIVRCP